MIWSSHINLWFGDVKKSGTPIMAMARWSSGRWFWRPQRPSRIRRDVLETRRTWLPKHQLELGNGRERWRRNMRKNEDFWGLDVWVLWYFCETCAVRWLHPLWNVPFACRTTVLNPEIWDADLDGPLMAARASSIISEKHVLGYSEWHYSNWGTLWWTSILLWKITIFNGKIHYKYSINGNFQLLC